MTGRSIVVTLALMSLSLSVATPGVAQVNRYTPVTDAMLQNPEPADWLSWRRTLDAQAHSPLDQITAENVGNLRLVWSWALRSGPQQTTPLVHDGILYIANPGEIVQALDAATGDLLWEYERGVDAPGSSFGGPPGGRMHRNISIYEDKIYLNTADAHVVAIDARTGDEVWETDIDQGVGYQFSSGSIVADGKVVSGLTGCGRYREESCYIVGLDAQTGEEIWRTSTVALPGQRGGDTWGDLPPMFRAGSDSWIPGSYDPVNNLAFFAPGNTYDTGPLRDLVSQPEVTNDALYLDSTLALNPDTGELVWHFQHQANGQWDLDWAFERQIIQLPVNGELKRLVVTTGKQAIFDLLEADTGKYVSSIDLGLQNLVTAIDPVTGAKTTDPRLLPGDGETKMVCPHVSGGRGWMPTSYDARSKVVYVPIVEACMDLVPVPDGERGSLSSGVRWTVRPRPESDGNYGRLEAVNLETGETMWITRQRAPQTTGTLVTAGGLVFAGALDRRVAAYDANTGDQLWQTRLNEGPSSAPISYAAGGKQYICRSSATGYGLQTSGALEEPRRGSASGRRRHGADVSAQRL